MWIDLFLEKRDVRKLVIYQEIATLKKIDLPSLKARTKCSESTILPLIQEIELDLADLTGAAFSLTRCFEESIFPDVHHYRQYLLEHSLVAQAFYTMLLSPDAGIKDFCAEQFLSRATVFRKLSVVKEILAPFHIQFNINQLELVGSELAIRYFFCNIFWFLKPHMIEEYPLEDGELNDLIDELCDTFDSVTTVGNKQKFELCLKIGHIRRTSGYFIKESIPSWVLVLPESFMDPQRDKLYSYLKKNCPTMYLTAEETSFYFILYSGAIYIHQETEVFDMFRLWSKQRYEPFTIIEDLANTIAAIFLPDDRPKNYDVIIANMTSVFSTCVVLNDAPPLIFLLLKKNWQINEPLSEHLYHYCFSYLKRISRRKKYTFLEDHLDVLAHLFTYFLWPSVNDAVRQQKLSVAIIAEDNFITMLPLYNFFTQHPYVTLCPYHAQEEIDLLVIPHHSFYPEHDTRPVFHYDYLAVENQFLKLKDVLATRQLHKYKSRLSLTMNSQ
ncbi:helix-turn-helix domain-containing protein [Enterococcus sp. DIV0876]|uniref:helix-turn-helix domain-containing protein n=1 Tax=Enterococcus sp. DIV0876 TaxID=2774633 RepID=UPI003D2FD14B